MKVTSSDGLCIGCGAKEDEHQCNCEWIECRCGHTCWIGSDGHYHCRNCDYCSDKKSYDW